MSSSLRSTLATEPGALAAEAAAWDALAAHCSRPFCAFTWLLGWWAHARPARAQLAVVLVHDGRELVGVAPGFCDRGAAGIVRWRPLGAGTCQRVEPFALPGREPEVAAAIAVALHGRRPRPQVLRFEGISPRSPWPTLLQHAWPAPGRTRLLRTGIASALVLQLDGRSFDDWFAAKTSHFRQRLRKARKAAVEAGGAFRLADASSAEADIESFLRVHEDRWRERGGSRAVGPPVAALLRATGPGLVAAGQLRVWSLDVGGLPVASSLVFRAGNELGYWLNGFDARHARLEPSKVSILRVVEDAFALGAHRVDLGEGTFAYKRRFADEEEELLRLVMVPPSRRALQVAVGLAPGRARAWAALHVPEERKAQLRAALGRT